MIKTHPATIEQKIGFEQVRELLLAKCVSSLGRSYAKEIRPSSDPAFIRKQLAQTSELSHLIYSGRPFPAAHYPDSTEHLLRLKVEGTYLDTEEAYDLLKSLVTVHKIEEIVRKNVGECPELKNLTGMITLPGQMQGWLEQVIDESGKMKGNASRELQRIRENIVHEQVTLRRVTEQISKEARRQGWSPEDSPATIRDGRVVLPVLAEHKRKLKGFVHDESATGQTVYLEPAETLEINNRVRELELAERREVIRILRELSDKLRPYVSALEKASMYLGTIDFIRARALLAHEIGGIVPQVSEKPLVKWKQAVHPLLFLLHKKAGKPIVPLDVDLNSEKRILIISGPNAGGKSVCLKTVVLLQYMLQCGLPIPLQEDSETGVFSNIFIDMGDEQSLENDLSTYSSHLTSMRFFMENANEETLFLIDEFGGGTDPQFGGAIAESILEQLHQSHSYGVITTHYGNLKNVAERHAGIVNGAMRYDLRELLPLYQLETGRPGSSFALEMAGNIGLPPQVIERAKALAGHSQVKLETLIGELEATKNDFETRLQSVVRKNKELEQAIKDYKELQLHIDSEKGKILKEAKQEAKKLVSEANKAIENTIREIRENKAEKVITRQVREKLAEVKEALTEKETEQEPAWEVADGHIKQGDKVRLIGHDSIGEVVAVKGKKAEVLMGDLKSYIQLGRLQKVQHREARKDTQRPATVFRGIDITQKMADYSTNLDVRGLRADEVIRVVDEFIDNSILFSANDLRIIHGKGDGILREVIRKHLSRHLHIAHLADEHIERGGSGVTVIALR